MRGLWPAALAHASSMKSDKLIAVLVALIIAGYLVEWRVTDGFATRPPAPAASTTGR